MITQHYEIYKHYEDLTMKTLLKRIQRIMHQKRLLL